MGYFQRDLESLPKDATNHHWPPSLKQAQSAESMPVPPDFKKKKERNKEIEEATHPNHVILIFLSGHFIIWSPFKTIWWPRPSLACIYCSSGLNVQVHSLLFFSLSVPLSHTVSSVDSINGLIYSNPSNSDWSILFITSLGIGRRRREKKKKN